MDAADKYPLQSPLIYSIIIPLRIVIGEGKFEEMMVASQEIAGSTAQLVIASRVKAKEGSNAFNELRLASRVVSEATGRVVAIAKDSSATADSKLGHFIF